jgi:class 3 adenylate cyclase/tetratricopeptide (TPR) repeat protein
LSAEARRAGAESRKTVTIVFCDMAGSTALADRSDPEVVRATLSRYYERMRVIVERHGGTVEKFIGDAVMAVFGVPQLHEDALRAVRAAAEMRDAFVELGIGARIGVNTGEVIAGSGDSLVAGDVVNVAARLEQAAATGEVVIGASTHRLVRDLVDAEPVEPLLLKGKGSPVEAYRLAQLLPEAAGPEAPGVGRRARVSMVGRQVELGRLQGAFEQAERGSSCQLFTILGMAGVGKSRLVAEFAGSLGAATVVSGRCLSYGEGITYWPIVELLGQMPAAVASEQDPVAMRAIASLRDESVTSTEEIGWAVRRLFERLARDKPLVVVFDDIHWAEPTLLDLIEQIADLSRGAPILIICTTRPELIDRRPGWAGGKLNATTVLLEPLTEDETGELIERLLAGAQMAGELRTTVGSAAEGNPLFVEEMVTLVQESGGRDVSVPPTVQALLAARLDQLDPAERAVLERASVEGRVFHREALAALLPEQPHVTLQLAALVRKELIRPDLAQVPGGDTYRFRHALIRDAAYQALPKAARADLHVRFGDWLEGRDAAGTFAEIIAYHLEQAHTYLIETAASADDADALAARAGRRLAEAARRALSRGDLHAGTNLLDRAAAVIPEGDSLWVPLQIDLGTALIMSGDFARVEECLVAANRAAAGDEHLELSSAMALAGARAWIGRVEMDELEEAIERAVPVFERVDDQLGLARAYNLLAEAKNTEGLMVGRLDALERGLVHARRAGARVEEQEILTYYAAPIVQGPMPVPDGIDRLRAALDGASVGAAAQVTLLSGLGELNAMQGDFEEAAALADRAIAIGEEFGLKFQLARARQGIASIHILRGDPAAAERELRKSTDAYLAMGEVGRRSTDTEWLAMAIYAQGRVQEAEEYAELGKQLSAPDDVFTLVVWRRVMAKIMARQGEAAEAEHLAREAVELIPLQSLVTRAEALVDLAQVLELGDRPKAAIDPLKQALALHEQKQNLVGTETARALLGALR